MPVPARLYANAVTRVAARLPAFRGVALVAVALIQMAGDSVRSAEPDDAALETVSTRTVRVSINRGGATRVVALPLEVYVARVLAGEGQPTAAAAAQQALAVAIRTFALANLQRHAREGADVCDTTHCQVVRGATRSSRSATLATTGRILTFQDRPAELFYSASCGGRTETASAVWPGLPDLPYLQPVRDAVHEHDEPWVADLSMDALARGLRTAGFVGSRLQAIDVGERTSSGRVATVRLRGLRPDTIAGDAFRAALGYGVIRSTAFTATRTSQGYRFTGTGYGHGVGMCVIGAGRLASRGLSAERILDLYYPGLTLTRLTGAVTAAVPSREFGGMATASPVIVRMRGAPKPPTTIEVMAAAAHAALARATGTSVAPISIDVHESVEAFTRATGRPWWASAVVRGTHIDLAPPDLLEQRGGVEGALRVAIAEVLVASAFEKRPAWVRIGAARFFARETAAAPLPARSVCPSDGELLLAVSAAAQRAAEARAEACFARARPTVADWRAVR